MKWRPILYSTPMIQAKLAGRKTQTRRLSGLEEINQKPDDWDWTRMSASDGECQEFLFRHKYYSDMFVKCPYGKPGDGLWLRESYAVAGARTRYKADYDWRQEEKELGETARWKPSIHMPKTACRLFDEIIRLKPERLQEISELGAIYYEGIEYSDEEIGYFFKNYTTKKGLRKLDGVEILSAKASFCTLWVELYGAASWDANSWVWVIETKSVDRPEGWLEGRV